MNFDNKSAEARLELLQLKQKLIKKIPDRLAGILILTEKIEDVGNSSSTELHKKLELQLLSELELEIHSMVGILGNLDLESESLQARLLSNQITSFKLKGGKPSSAEWDSFRAIVNLLTTNIQRVSLDSFAINTARKELRPGKGIWIVDDDADQSELICNWLKHEGYQTRSFMTLDDFIKEFSIEEKPDIILMDMKFKEGEFAGAKRIASLQVKYGHLPPIVFISVHNNLQARLLAFRAGATRYLVKPLKREYLLSLIAELSSEAPSSPYKIHLLDDDGEQLKFNQFYLELAGFDVSTSKNPLALIDDLQRFTPDAVVLDVYMPDASGPELAAILREMPEYKHLPVLFLSSELDPSKHLLALGMGGDEYLVKPVQPNRLVACLRKHARNARLQALADKESSV